MNEAENMLYKAVTCNIPKAVIGGFFLAETPALLNIMHHYSLKSLLWMAHITISLLCVQSYSAFFPFILLCHWLHFTFLKKKKNPYNWCVALKVYE